MEGKTTNNGNSIESFYMDTVILITGATGFVGQALLEKLLHSCPRVSTIYILIRNKRGRTMEERVKQLKNFSVFDRLRTEDPSALDKICPIEGDISLPNLGLTPEVMNTLVNKVNIVFHGAATVRFDESLKVAVNVNTKGSERLVDLCKRMRNLICFVYISTAFSNANRCDVDEVIYNSNLQPSTVIEMCRDLDSKTLAAVEKLIIEGHPNTYTYTKNLAERLVVKHGAELPVAIVRPSVICAAVKEPFPGWLYGFSGFTGVLTEAGRGTFRYFKTEKDSNLDIIPIDHVVDTIICVPWHRSIQTNNSIPIYNCTNNGGPLSVSDMIYYGLNACRKEISQYTVWYPDITIGTNSFKQKYVKITQHLLLAFILDIIFRLKGIKPINMEIARRLDRGVKATKYFTNRKWNFHRNNMRDLAEKVKMLKDSNNFNINVIERDLHAYATNYWKGIKKYLLNENIDSVNVQNRLLILYCLHRFLQILTRAALLAVVIWIMLTILEKTAYIGTSVVNVKN